MDSLVVVEVVGDGLAAPIIVTQPLAGGHGANAVPQRVLARCQGQLGMAVWRLVRDVCVLAF